MQLRHPFFPRLVFRPREVTHYIRFGLRTAASQVLYQLYTNLDYPIVGHYFGTRANGIYFAAYSIVLEPVKTIANVVIDVAFPTFARLRNDRAGLIEQFIQFTRLNLIAVLPFVVLILLVMPEFLTLSTSADDVVAARARAVRVTPRASCASSACCARSASSAPAARRHRPSRAHAALHGHRGDRGAGHVLLGATSLGDRLGFLSVAVAWAVGYPIAFAALSAPRYRDDVDLPIATTRARGWGIFGCAPPASPLGLGRDLSSRRWPRGIRLVAIGAPRWSARGALAPGSSHAALDRGIAARVSHAPSISHQVARRSHVGKLSDQSPTWGRLRASRRRAATDGAPRTSGGGSSAGNPSQPGRTMSKSRTVRVLSERFHASCSTVSSKISV